MTWIKDNEDAYHNSDEFCQISVVFDDDKERYVIRAYSKIKGFVDMFSFTDLDEAKLYLKNLMSAII